MITNYRFIDIISTTDPTHLMPRCRHIGDLPGRCFQALLALQEFTDASAGRGSGSREEFNESFTSLWYQSYNG